MNKIIKSIHEGRSINGLIPRVIGHRAFPTKYFRNTDPFLMLDHIGPERVGKDYFLDGTGHSHPHRGFETITFMFEGRMEHVDSLGNNVTLGSGDVQRMNAGSGIIHGGDMASDIKTERFHEVQLWVNNPTSEKMSEPEIQNVHDNDFPTIETENISIRVISGILNDQTGLIKTKAKTRIGHLIAKGKGEIKINDLTDDDQLLVYVLEGETKIGDASLTAFQLAEIGESGNSLLIQTETKCQLLILGGQRLNEPVVFGGPFVMNTEEEIKQAQLDFKSGLFGVIN